MVTGIDAVSLGRTGSAVATYVAARWTGCSVSSGAGPMNVPPRATGAARSACAETAISAVRRPRASVSVTATPRSIATSANRSA